MASSTSPAAAPPVDGAEIMRQFLPASPFVGHLGIRLVELSADRAVLEMPFRPELATLANTVHGGALAALLDTTAMAASWSGAVVPTTLRGSTVSLTVNYLRPADGEDIQAVGRLLRRGRKLTSVDVEAATPAGDLVAKALVVYQLG